MAPKKLNLMNCQSFRQVFILCYTGVNIKYQYEYDDLRIFTILILLNMIYYHQ